MKRSRFLFAGVALLVGLGHPALAQHVGVPDTLYVEVHPPDVQPSESHCFDCCAGGI